MRRVLSSLTSRVRRFHRLRRPLCTRHVGRHIRCSVRVLHRLNRYTKVRGCSHCFSNHRPKRGPCYLLSFFPGSLLIIVSRDRIAVPRLTTVSGNSHTEGAGLIRCNFHLPTTFSGQPLHFRRFGDYVRRIVCISTAPTSCRLRRTRNIIIRRVVHPAKLLSPDVIIQPAGGRVSGLVRRVVRHVSRRRHALIAALAGHVTRRLARCLLRRGVRTGCVRSSITALSHIAVVGSLEHNICSILIKIGLLHRNLSLPRISLITVLSTSGRNFLHSRHDLARATKQTTERVRNAIVVCTSRIARSVRGAVSRARQQEAVRRRCGTSRRVAPEPVAGGNDVSLIITASDTTPTAAISLSRSPVVTRVAPQRLRRLVRSAARHVATTTRRLRFLTTTRLESRILRLRRLLRRESWLISRKKGNRYSNVP